VRWAIHDDTADIYAKPGHTSSSSSSRPGARPRRALERALLDAGADWQPALELLGGTCWSSSPASASPGQTAEPSPAAYGLLSALMSADQARY